ncbi:MAG: hypothetical protein WC850_06015 [Candidatus Gracilibacteria bacterium]
MEFLAMYILPAQKKSLDLFQKTSYYFFGLTSTTKIDFDKMNKSVYLGLGYEYELKDSEDEYIKVMKGGEIIEIGNFEIDLNGKIVGDSPNKIELQSAFEKHFSHLHKFENGDIKTELPNKIEFIKVKDIFDIHEKILYPSKQFIGFPLLDKGFYKNHVYGINIFKINNCLFLINEDKLELENQKIVKLGNNGIYGKILELLCKSDNFEFSLEKYKELEKMLPKGKIDINKNTVKGFNDKLSKYLGFKLKYDDYKFKKH